MEYTRLNSDILAFLRTRTRSDGESRQDKDYLEYKVQHLQGKFRDLVAMAQSTAPQSDSWNPLRDDVLMSNLETFVSVRAPHARMLVRKPLLRADIDNRQKRAAAGVAIICVKETISLCSRAIDQSILLKYLRGSCEFFVISSLAIIVLVVSQGPETYGPESREAVQTAIDILGVSKCRNFTNQ